MDIMIKFKFDKCFGSSPSSRALYLKPAQYSKTPRLHSGEFIYPIFNLHSKRKITLSQI